jgi:hypothetical protein
MVVAVVDRLDELQTAGSGSKMVATGRGDTTKCWSWREELNLQPAVYRDHLKQLLQTIQPHQKQGKVATSLLRKALAGAVEISESCRSNFIVKLCLFAFTYFILSLLIE